MGALLMWIFVALAFWADHNRHHAYKITRRAFDLIKEIKDQL